VFISRGNHDDSSWSGYLPKANSHLGGATREAGAHDANYKTTYRGLVIATIRKGDSGSNITPFLQGDPHIWKICNWHQNQAAMQVGGKGDEMGWNVYETCRQQGAIIQTGHEHSYERTKTLTNMASQVVDASCASASVLCVGAGRTFTSVVGLGGNSVRDQTRCLSSVHHVQRRRTENGDGILQERQRRDRRYVHDQPRLTSPAHERPRGSLSRGRLPSSGW
jgi:hypothetical protein